MIEINRIIKIYEDNNLLLSANDYNNIYKYLVKMVIEYKDFKKYIYMNKWDDFFMIYKKIKKDNNYINFYEVVDKM
jgi:hypothetical protein